MQKCDAYFNLFTIVAVYNKTIRGIIGLLGLLIGTIYWTTVSRLPEISHLYQI